MPDSAERRTVNRRDWLQGIARAGVLGGLGIGAAWLVARGGGIRVSACLRAPTCSGCPKVAQCTLPKRFGGENKERSYE